MGLNYYVLLGFAPILVLVGVLGFVIPERKSLTSGAHAYNIFHIAFGLIGLSLIYSGSGDLIRGFNIGFGLIDLYQAVASRFGWFPSRQFRWEKADDVLHVVIGLGLIVVGMFAS